MSKEIKQVVDKLEIDKLREDYYNNQRRLLELRYQMNRMTFNINVARYAWYLDWIHYYVLDSKDSFNSKEIYEKIKEYEKKALELEVFPEVVEYSKLRDEYYKLLFDHKYYRTINEGLRYELELIGVPPIFVKQHEYEDSINIVNGSTDMHNIYFNQVKLIEPVYDMKSYRDYRHFYNRTSFKYLEQLTRDHEYSLEGKNLGKVKIKTLR